MGDALGNGLREIVRKVKRAGLRRRIAAADRARDDQITALGRRAWETGLTVSAADDVARQIAGTETQEAAVAARREVIEAQRKEHEGRKQAETQRFADAEADVKTRKAPVDADLSKRRADLGKLQGDATTAKRRLTEIDAARRALEAPPKPDAPAADPAKAAAQIEALAGEKAETETRLGAMTEPTAAASADVQRLEAQSRALQDEIDRVAAERRKVIGEIDKSLAEVGRALAAAGKEGAAIQTQRAGHLKELGTRLFASASDEPALAETMAAARTADERCRELRAALEASLAQSKTMPRWTMFKFWGIGAAALLVVFLISAVRSPGLPPPVRYPELSPAVPLPRDPVRTAMTTEGGVVELPGFATATFFSGTLAAAQTVTLSATATAETASDFRVTAEIFAPGPRLPYEIRVNVGPAVPRGRVTVAVALPESFTRTKPEGYEIRAFAQMLEEGGEDVLDSFEVVRSSISDGKLIVDLYSDAFTDQRGSDGTFEAVITTAPTRAGRRVPPKRSDAPRSTFAAAVDLNWLRDIIRDVTRQREPCDRSQCDFAPPVLPLQINSRFSPGSDHYGTDYKADNGQAVSPAVRGRVVRIGFDERPLKEPNKRSGKKVRGWGRYVILEHCDGSRTVYAHLEMDSTKHMRVGQTVGPADIIGQADNTGGSSGPHLHMEYWPSGRGGAKNSADPQLCQVYME